MLNSEVRVEGLETLDYLDNLYQKERFTEQGDALTFESEVKTNSHTSVPGFGVLVTYYPVEGTC